MADLPLKWKLRIANRRAYNRHPWYGRIVFGLGFDNDGRANWRWASNARGWLSRNLLIGSWFKGSETCEVCGCTAADAEYAFDRIGFHRARCDEGFECAAEATPPPRGDA